MHVGRAALVPSILLLSLTACTQPDRPSSEIPPAPEASSGYSAKPGWAFQRFAVAAANPLATEAGYEILKAGGSAMDAAVAVQMVLEPE